MSSVPATAEEPVTVLSDAVVRAVALSRQRAGIRVLVVGYASQHVTMPVGSSRRVGPPSFWVMPDTNAIIFDPLDNVTSRMRVEYIPYNAVVWHLQRSLWRRCIRSRCTSDKYTPPTPESKNTRLSRAVTLMGMQKDEALQLDKPGIDEKVDCH